MGATQRSLPRRTIGLCVDPLQGRVRIAAADISGQCLSGKLTHVAGATRAFPDDLHRDLEATLHDDPRPPTEIADLSARLAEFEAETVRRFLHAAPAAAGIDAEPLLIAVDDPYVRHAAGRPWQSVLALGDPARLAELTGLNVLDACEARHVAVGSEAAAFDTIALWLLLHSPKRDRVYLELLENRPAVRVIVLPAGCEPSAAGRIAVRTMERPLAAAGETHTWSDLAWQVVDVLNRLVPQSPNPLQLLARAAADEASWLMEEISRIAPFTEPLDLHDLQVSFDWLDAAVAAGLAHLFLDHIPQAAATPDLTRPPRLLGRLTPGSTLNWHRLLEYLAASLPHHVPLRAAI